MIGGFVDWIDSISGASAYGVVSTWPFAAQVAFFVVTHDLYIYWFHRWQHANRWLWRLHEAHHSARDVDWIAGARSHANVDVRTGWLQVVINGPEMHRWHHALDFVAPGGNFATKLAIWDYVFHTARRPDRKPDRYGLVEPFPEGFLAQQLYAFRRAPDQLN